MTDMINDADHRTENKLTAVQVEESCPVELQELGTRITAHLAKAAKCEDKAEQHRISAGQLLVEAKRVCDDSGFDAFREKCCPKLGKTRAYELLAIGTNKKTVEEIRAEGRVRQAKSRANKKETTANSVTVTENEATPVLPQEAPTGTGEVEATGIVPEQTLEPAKPRSAIKSKDSSVTEFTAILCRLLEKIDKQRPDRFEATAIPTDKLAKLGKYLTNLADLKNGGISMSTPTIRPQGNGAVSPDQSAKAMKAAHEANEARDVAPEGNLPRGA